MQKFNVQILSLITIAIVVVGVVSILLNSGSGLSSNQAPSQSRVTPVASTEPTDPIYRWPASTATAFFLTRVAETSNMIYIKPPLNRTGINPLQRQLFLERATFIAQFNADVVLTVTAYYRTPEGLRTGVPTPELAIQPTIKLPEALILELTATDQP